MGFKQKLLNILTLSTLLLLFTNCDRPSSSKKVWGADGTAKGNANCNIDKVTEQCQNKLPKTYTHLKTYNITSQEELEHAYIFSKNTDYLITVLSSKPGQQISFTLYDAEHKPIISNEYEGKRYETIAYHCKNTGKHYMSFSFEDKAFCAASVLGFKRR